MEKIRADMWETTSKLPLKAKDGSSKCPHPGLLPILGEGVTASQIFLLIERFSNPQSEIIYPYGLTVSAGLAGMYL